MNPYSFSVLAFGFCSFLIGLFVWFRLENKTGFYYFAFSGCAGLWGMTLGVVFIDGTMHSTALLLARLSNVAACWISPMWYLFTLSFLENRITKIDKCVSAFLTAFSAFILLNTFSEAFIPKVQSILTFKYYAYPGILFYLYTASFFGGVILGFFNLFKLLNISLAKDKEKIQSLIFSTGLGFVGGSLSFFPVYGIEFPQYGMWLLPIYPILMALSMMKFNLFSERNFALAAHKDKLAALGILTASINHEIRAPLFMMRGLAETQAKDNELSQKFLTQIDRINGIVSRLTHFAKKGVEEEAKIEQIDLKEVLADIRPLFQHQLNYQSIEYTQDIPADLPKVMADRRYLEEILFNLILNACQALKNTQKPQIKLSACVFEGHRLQTKDNRLSNLSSPSSQGARNGFGLRSSVVSPSSITIVIEDNGPGIPPDQLKNIFKPFHTTKQEGTGLGLYITKQLVEKCDGKIEAKSQLGNGAQFVVRFHSK